jgi:hypothetical protein
MLRKCLAVAAAVLIGLGAPSANAQEDFVAWDFTLDNDKWGDGTDRHYTHGSRIARSSSSTPQWVRRVFAPLRCLACTSPRSFKAEVGQEIYTPENTWTSGLVVDDRPYAGWAYGSLTLFGQRDKAVNEVTLELGVIGPASGAERMQAFIHRERDVGAAQGWHHQLENEPGAVLTYKRGMRAPIGREGGAFRHEITPYFEGAVGNVRAYAGGGVTWRSGRNLDGRRVTTPGWRLFADVNAKAVGRNSLLGGYTESGTAYAVEPEPVVVTVAAGVEFEAPRFRVSFTRERRGPEFVGQYRADEYGSIAFSIAP